MARNATVTPNVMARLLSTNGRTVTSKAVRAMARAVLPGHDKSKPANAGYQSHAYTAAEQRTLRAAFAERAQRSTAQRKPASKPARNVRKAQRAAKASPDAADQS